MSGCHARLPPRAVAPRLWTEQTAADADALGSGYHSVQRRTGARGQSSLLSILDTVELHHGSDSHDPPVTVIEVLGTRSLQEQRALASAVNIPPVPNRDNASDAMVLVELVDDPVRTTPR